MKDKNVEVLLQTPLLTFLTREEMRAAPSLEHISKIIGKVIAESSGGITLSVKGISSHKAANKNPPFSEIFIPYHKIDHILFI